MRPVFWRCALSIASLVFAGMAWAARCTTVLNPEILPEYEGYVSRAEQAMPARFAKSELAWLDDAGRKQALVQLNAGRQIRSNISDAALNQRLSVWNGAVIDWIGAIRIHNTRMQDLVSVLQNYGQYSSIFKPLIYDCRSVPVPGSIPAAFDVTFGIQHKYRTAMFPLHYAFEAKTRTEFSGDGTQPGATLLVHSRSTEVRESDSGEPGKLDFMELYHDHGAIWALNTYWRARQAGPDLYVEFETITLARSIQEFNCKIGPLPVPKLVIAGAMDAIPDDSVNIMLAGAKAECERGASGRSAGRPRP